MDERHDLDGLGAIAAADQGQAIARTWAIDVAAYYQTLRMQRCGREAALWLARDFQAMYLAHVWPLVQQGAP